MGEACEADQRRRQEAGRDCSVSEDLGNGMRREVHFLPGFDHRQLDCGNGTRGANHGQHGMTMSFYLVGPDGATVFSVFLTNWVPGRVRYGTIEAQSEVSAVAYIGNEHPAIGDAMAADFGYHWKRPQYPEQEEWRRDDCDVASPCYYDGSGLNAEPVLAAFLEYGPHAVWAHLARFYAELAGRQREALNE